jgi:hypothetical protein
MSLITLEEYKAYKQVTNTAKDTFFNVIIESVSELIKAYCNRTFTGHFAVAKVVTKTVPAGVKSIILDEIPVVNLVSVLQNGVNITSSVSINQDYGFLNFEFQAGATIVITYTGGTEKTPADIKLAALELVDFYVNDEHKSRKTFAGSTVEYQEVGNEWPIHIQYILNAHRDV